MLRIGIEPNLTNIKDYLEDQGCEVSTITPNNSNLNIFDCIVVTGLDDDVMGIEDTTTNAPIIECTGMTPEEVYEEIQNVTDF